MAKKPKDNGWVFVEGTDSVEGKKTYRPGHVAEVTGRDMDEAKRLAGEQDRRVEQREKGQAEQAKDEYDRLLAEAERQTGHKP